MRVKFAYTEMVRGGRVCIAGRRIAVWDLTGRFSAGETIASIAKDMELTREQVEAGLQLGMRALSGRNGEKFEARMRQVVDCGG